MYIDRILNLNEVLEKKSCFLFGPRQTGKSFLISHTMKKHRIYSLLDSEVYLSFSQNLKRLEQELQPTDKLIIIDEIQKLPELLNEVHLIIEKYGISFLLTGSSARKLRKGGVNLLGGRARSRILHPFIYKELKEKFNLLRALDIGLLPSIYLSDAPQDDLRSYTGDYLQEEISAESLVRNIPAFSRFLQVAAVCNSQIINYAKISSDAQVPASTIQEYFQILKDTLLAFELPAWKKSLIRKPITTSKYYFFDVGVVRYLQQRRGLEIKSPEIGEAFETYMAHELRAFCDYNNIENLNYWRSKSDFEVDFILNNQAAIEIKAKDNVSDRDLRGIKALMEEKLLEKYYIVCFEPRPRKVDGIELLPWNVFLEKLWNSEIISF